MSVSAGLPNGSQLAQRIHREFDGFLDGYECNQPGDLVAVATAVAAVQGGLEALQFRLPSLAPFNSASPTTGHKLLALLLAEGAIRLLTTNWDDCLERGWSEERISVAANGMDADQFRVTHILKLHGCSTRPQTLLITKDQLEAPPFWAESAISVEIASSTMVFIGIGDVAPYTQKPIAELARHVAGARVRVVSPGIVSKWDDSEWKEVLPDLSPDRRLPMTASEFAEELARGWLHQLLRKVSGNNTPVWIAACLDSFGSLTALDALRWLRRAAFDWQLGESVAKSDEALAGLKAVAIRAKQVADERFAGKLPEIRFKPKSAVMLGEERLEVLFARPHQTATAIARAARDRAENIAIEYGVDSVAVLCAASWVQGERPSALVVCHA